MKSKNSPKAHKLDKAWQQRVEKQVKTEKVDLDHTQGKERFDKVIKNALKKNPK